MQERTAIVTGATGCVGHAVVDALLGDPRCIWDIWLPLRATSNTNKIKDLLPLVRTLDWPHRWPAVDAIFHCAGNTSYHNQDREALWRDNVSLTEDVCSRVGEAKLIHTSTAATWAYRPWSKTNKPENYYAYSKAAAEWIVQRNVANSVVLQPCIILGEHDHNNYARLFDLASKDALFGAFKGGIEFGYVKDIAKAHVQAYWTGKSGGYYLLGGVKSSWKDFFAEVCFAVGRPKWNLKAIPTWMLKMYCFWLKMTKDRPDLTPNLVDMLAVDATVPWEEARRSEADLNYRPTVSLREMVNQAHKWWKQNV